MSSAGTQVLGGSGVNDQALNWFNSIGSYDNTRRGQDITSRGQDQQQVQFLMDFYQKGEQAKQQYALDAARFGEEQARRIFEEKLAAAQADLSERQYGLSVDQSNFNQRNQVEDKRLQIMDMLNKRTGPQDWVKYQSLLNQLSPPDPTGSATIDPFATLNGLYQPSAREAPGNRANITPTQGAQFSAPASESQPSYEELMRRVMGTSATGSGSQTTAVPASSAGATQPIDVAIDFSGGNPAASGNYGNAFKQQAPPDAINRGAKPAYQWSDSQQGWIDPTTGKMSDGLGHYWDTAKQTWQNDSGGAYQKLGRGGQVAGAAIVGDNPHDTNNPTGFEELVMQTRPDPSNPIMVMPLHGDNNNGAVRMSKELGARAMGTGGEVFQGAPATAANGYTPTTDWSPGFVKRDLLANKAFYDPQTYNDIMSYTPEQMANVESSTLGSFRTGMNAMPGQDPAALRKAFLLTQPGYNGAQQNSSPVTMTGYGSGQQAQMPAAASNDPYAGEQGMADTGGDAAGQYGTDANRNRLIYNRYAPKDLAQQGFIQKVMGNQVAAPYQGFGSELSNPELGITNMPDNVNMNVYNNLQESEKLALQELISKGLSYDWGDYMSRSMRAAPTGRNLGNSLRGGPQQWIGG